MKGSSQSPKKHKHLSIGRNLSFFDYSFVGGKKRFWNQNFGFFSSDQIEKMSQRFKTQGNQREEPRDLISFDNARFLIDKEAKSIEKTSTYNPQNQKFGDYSAYLKKNQHENQAKNIRYQSLKSRNSDAMLSTKHKSKEQCDKSIQVNLPPIKFKHTANHQNCPICKIKNKKRQHIKRNFKKKYANEQQHQAGFKFEYQEKKKPFI